MDVLLKLLRQQRLLVHAEAEMGRDVGIVAGAIVAVADSQEGSAENCNTKQMRGGRLEEDSSSHVLPPRPSSWRRRSS